ncbi:hypothetical protein DKM44_11605 [Deinococcus irradiatisoli]|uniref:DUF1795 domain-containing protein n=1 Tax=Deinococcus irradiatisoli TaxID=2202254 RepID=A0A2Z3JJN8_9DEIO|nr:hypothetical protein [Deinococcus irradiatisoli]AWN23791.1 hypothetical protein DKM44_11605 [Deinococcus irradiatisoli]
MRLIAVSAPLACALLGGAALALTPPSGWVEAGPNLWRDASGACVLREQDSKQDFAPLLTQQGALSLGNKLKVALAKQGMSNIAIQPVSQTSDWSVLAAYTYTQEGVRYQIAQLYLSQGGKLHTITGSNSEGEASGCVNVMRNFLKGK